MRSGKYPTARSISPLSISRSICAALAATERTAACGASWRMRCRIFGMKTSSPRSVIAKVKVSCVLAGSKASRDDNVPSTRDSASRNGSYSACMRAVGCMP